MFKYYRSVLAVSAVALGLAACGDNVAVTNPPPATRVVHSVTVVPTSATVNVGQAGVTFVASVNADSAIATTVNWTSTNHTVATVDGNGVITALAPGQATIVATSTVDGSKTGAGSLTVVALPPNISAFSVNPTNGTIAVGGTLQANPSITLANGAPAATYAWTSSNANIASVNASGTITGVSAGNAIITATATSGTQTATATVGVNVGAGPAGVVSFSISPSAATLFAGQTVQIVPTITVAPTFTAPTITWTSLAPSVATVSGTGLVTAQAQGTAVITATIGTAPNTITQSAVITVGQSATISIANVVAGATAGVIPNCAGAIGSPVLLSNVNCQIEVNLNLDPGSQRIDSVTVWFIQGGVTKKLARQFYGGTIPAAGGIGLSVNTANFSKNRAAGTAVVDLWNGPTVMVAQIWPTSGGSTSAINCQIGAGNPDPTCSNLSMVLNNTDGWSADITKCSGVIADGVICPAAVPANVGATGGFATDVDGSSINAGKTYWGGPGATGQIAAELYAVVYNDNPGSPSGSALNRCNNLLGDGTGCITNVNWTIGSSSVSFGHCDYTSQSATASPATPIFFQVFGSTGPAVTNDCTGHENLLNRRDNILIQNGVLDAQNNNYPNGALIPNTVVFGATPDSFRLDWKGPSSINTPTIVGAENKNWVNANWNFDPCSGCNVSDNGVGPAQGTWGTYVSGGPTPGISNVLTTTGASLAESNTNLSDGYNAYATATDRLGNSGNSGTVSTFGVDKTSPLLRYSTTTAPSSFAAAYINGGNTAVSLDSTTYAAFEGIYGANIVTPGAQTLFVSAAAGTNDSVRVDALDGRSGLSRFVENTKRFSQGGAAGTVSTVYSTTGGFIGTGLIDGWQVAPALHVTNGRVPGAPPVLPGYFTTTEYVIDNAGNVSGCPAVGTVAAPIAISGSFCGGATAGAIAPNTTQFSNPAMVGGQPGTNANLFARRTLAIDPGQPIVTGVSPNNSYTGNNQAIFTLGSQDDLEVIDARLRIQYPNLTTGAAAVVASPGLVWSYALSNTFMASFAGNNAGPASGTGTNWGYFSPIGRRFDGAVNALPGNGLGIVDPQTTPLTLDQFTLDVQETCLGAASPTANCAVNGDPIPSVDVNYTSKPAVTPNNVAVQVRDVFGSWIFNTVAGAATGVSAEFVSPLLPNTVAAPGGYSVSYFNAGALTSCPQGGVVQLANTTSCVQSGVNFRAEPTLSSAAVKVFRSTESFSTTLPIFKRVDLFGLNAANEWVFIQRCTVPVTIIPNSGSQSCGSATVAGTDNGNERYWIYSFTGVASAGFTQFRALGVNGSGFGLFSTREP
jgi:uncharacterized protein YjdB